MDVAYPLNELSQKVNSEPFIDIGFTMWARRGGPPPLPLPQQAPSVQTRLVYFAIFRTMIYCDEMHDFGKYSEGGNEISQIRSEMCWEDIVWFNNSLNHNQSNTLTTISDLVELFNSLKLNAKQAFDVNKNRNPFLGKMDPGIGGADLVKWIDGTLAVPGRAKTLKPVADEWMKNPLISILTQVESYESNVVRASFGKYCFVGSYDDTAKGVAEILLHTIGIVKSNVIDALGCTVRGHSISSQLKLVHVICYPTDTQALLATTGELKNVPVRVTIDQEGSDQKVAFYKELYENNYINHCVSSAEKKAYYDSAGGSIQLFSTYATLMDPGNEAFTKLRGTMQRSGGSEVLHVPEPNKHQIIYFFGIPIIQYVYRVYDQDYNNMTNNFLQIFSVGNGTTLLGKAHTRAHTGLQKILLEIKNDDGIINVDSLKKGILFYKTFGDLNQVIQFQRIVQNVDVLQPAQRLSALYIFMTGDKMCGMISALLSKNVVTEAQGERELGNGMTIYLSELEQANAKKYVELFDSGEGGLALLSTLAEMTPRATGFGKKHISKKLKLMSTTELKTKLKSVGIRVTKDIRGKRKELTRKELESKATLFKNLQLRAKSFGVRLMYKNKKKVYFYKSKDRLENEIKIHLEKMKKSQSKTKSQSQSQSKTKSQSKSQSKTKSQSKSQSQRKNKLG